MVPPLLVKASRAETPSGPRPPVNSGGVCGGAWRRHRFAAERRPRPPCVSLRVGAAGSSRRFAFTEAAAAGGDGARRVVRKDDDVEVLVEVALANVSIDQTRVGNVVLVEDEARPAFIHGRHPALVEPDARQMNSKRIASRNRRSRLDIEREIGSELC